MTLPGITYIPGKSASGKTAQAVATAEEFLLAGGTVLWFEADTSAMVTLGRFLKKYVYRPDHMDRLFIVDAPTRDDIVVKPPPVPKPAKLLVVLDGIRNMHFKTPEEWREVLQDFSDWHVEDPGTTFLVTVPLDKEMP